MPSTKAKNRYNSANYTRFAVFTDRDTGNRIREAAEVSGESLNSFIIKGVLSRINGGDKPKVSIPDKAGAERLITEFLINLKEYQVATDQQRTTYSQLKKSAERMAELIKVGLE